ncbi:hypothetical protein LRE75_29240 [Streptomyces sp. 372A]
MKVTLDVCNVCKVPGLPVARYLVRREGGTLKKLDLCATDAAPLEDLLTHAEDEARPRSGAPRPRKRKVMTLEEIDALKRKADRSAPAENEE